VSKRDRSLGLSALASLANLIDLDRTPITHTILTNDLFYPNLFRILFDSLSILSRIEKRSLANFIDPDRIPIIHYPSKRSLLFKSF